jgi:hypothetical protein
MLLDLLRIPLEPDTHLRDARHAHQIFNLNNFEFSPKVKFLYQTVFVLNPQAYAPTTWENLKEISVLTKSVDLPQYRSTVETKQQYNRKKNVQTRIDYQEVRCTFHDDNVGLTRKLFEEYYRYYWRDGNKNNDGSVVDYNPRDKFDNYVPKYGLDNNTVQPFFQEIRIYQLSRQEWFAYTLVNPLITQWGHDTLDYAEGAGVVENTMTLAYEAVLYNQGTIRLDGPPEGFGDASVGYDVTPSPLTAFNNNKITRNSDILSAINEIRNFSSVFQNAKENPRQAIFQLLSENQTGGLQGLLFPKRNTQETVSLSSSPSRTIKNLDPDTIKRNLTTNKAALDTVVKQSLASGAFSPEWNSSNFSRYDSLSSAEKAAIESQVINRASGSDKKIQQIASKVLAG